MMEFLERYVDRQRRWSQQVFGNGRRTGGIVAHIRKELGEIEADPTDLTEWVDVMILAMDGYWRHGGTPDSLAEDLELKQSINFRRKWPEPGPEDQAVEHVRTEGK